MSTFGKKILSMRTKPNIPSGKENAWPSNYDKKRKLSSANKDRQGEEIVPKRHLSLPLENASNMAIGTGVAGFPSKKPRFHIHCDYKNSSAARKSSVSKIASNQRPSRVDLKTPRVLSVSNKNEDDVFETAPQGSEKPRKLNSQVSKVPLSVSKVKDNVTTRRSSSLTTIKSQCRNLSTLSNSRSMSATRAGRSRSPLHLKRWISSTKYESPSRIGSTKMLLRPQLKKQRVTENHSGSVASFRRMESVTNIKRKLSAINLNNLKKPGLETQLPNAVPKRLEATINTNTPTDLLPPISPLLSKPMRPRLHQREEKINVNAAQLLKQIQPSEIENFSALALHVDYHQDIPKIELEREKLAPQLSEEFLCRNFNAEQRKLVVSFLIRLGTHCQYHTSIIHQTVKLFDVAMDRLKVKTNTIQLIALAALWIALKSQINTYKIPSASTILALANGFYEGKEDFLIKYERIIIQALNFNLTFADMLTLFSYHLLNCKHYLDISEEKMTFVYHCGGYLLDLTLLDEDFCRISPSLIAFSVAELALGLGIDAIQVDAKPRWTLWRLLITNGSVYFGTLRDEDVAQVRIEIIRRAMNSVQKHSVFHVVYKKYKRSRYGNTAKTLAARLEFITMEEILEQ